MKEQLKQYIEDNALREKETRKVLPFELQEQKVQSAIMILAQL